MDTAVYITRAGNAGVLTMHTYLIDATIEEMTHERKFIQVTRKNDQEALEEVRKIQRARDTVHSLHRLVEVPIPEN